MTTPLRLPTRTQLRHVEQTLDHATSQLAALLYTLGPLINTDTDEEPADQEDEPDK